MKKITSIWLFAGIHFMMSAQSLEILKEAHPTSQSTIFDFQTVDNDVFISLQENATTFGVFHSNGTETSTEKIQDIENSDKLVFTGRFRENYIIDTDVFIFSNGSSFPSKHKAYRVSNNRKNATEIIETSPSSEWMIRSNNNKLIKQSKTFYATSTDSNGNRRPSGFTFLLNIYNSDGTLERNVDFDGNLDFIANVQDRNSLSGIFNIFFWKGEYYFVGSNTQNREDFYRLTSNSYSRITKLYVSGNSNTAVDPQNILLNKDFIHFTGEYRTWNANDSESDFEQHGRELCYTNGSEFFGNNETAIPNFLSNKSGEAFSYDGSRGYKAEDTSNGVAWAIPIAVLNNYKIFIQRLGNDGKLMSLNTTNNNIQELLEDVDPVSSIYFTYNNKLYFKGIETVEGVRKTYVYEFDGNPANTFKFEMPSNGGITFGASSNGYDSYYLDETNGKIIISGSYPKSFRERRPAIITLDLENKTVNEEVVFEHNQLDSFSKNFIKNARIFNNGFVFTSHSKVFAYGVEPRSKTITPNNDSFKSTTKKSSEEIVYKSSTYKTEVQTSNLATNESLHIQLLDTTSVLFKSKIISFPDKAFSSTFYKITTSNNSTHESTITLAFNSNNFEVPVTSASDLSLLKLEAGNYEVVSLADVNLSDGHATFSGNFTGEEIFIFKNNKVLSNKDYSIKNTFKIYPNPALNNVTISSNTSIKSIEIFSALGKRVLQKKSEELNDKAINVSTLKAGIYLLKINNKEFRKLIVN
jgi:hypothetical protein